MEQKMLEDMIYSCYHYIEIVVKLLQQTNVQSMKKKLHLKGGTSKLELVEESQYVGN